MAFIKFKIEPNPTDLRHLKCRKSEDYSPGHFEELSNHHPSLRYLRSPETQQSLPTTRRGSFFARPDEHPLAQYLESLSKTVLGILCFQKDFTHPLILKHISPNFSAQQDGRVNSKSREEHFAIWANFVDKMPDYGWEVIESVVEIHEGGKKAKHWSFKRLSGLRSPHQGHGVGAGPGMCQESVGVMKWELQGETWVCTRLKMMTGVSGVLCEAVPHSQSIDRIVDSQSSAASA